jgi:hypothetical protein
MTPFSASRFVFLAALLSLVGVVAISGCSSSSNKATSPDCQVTSDALINEHVANKANAQSKYQGKTIHLTGKVFMVWDSTDNIVSSPYLHFAHSGSRPDHIACCFSNPQAVKPFTQGEAASVVGRYEGTIKGGTAGSFIVVLKDCKAANYRRRTYT